MYFTNRVRREQWNKWYSGPGCSWPEGQQADGHAHQGHSRRRCFAPRCTGHRWLVLWALLRAAGVLPALPRLACALCHLLAPVLGPGGWKLPAPSPAYRGRGCCSSRSGQLQIRPVSGKRQSLHGLTGWADHRLLVCLPWAAGQLQRLTSSRLVRGVVMATTVSTLLLGQEGKIGVTSSLFSLGQAITNPRPAEDPQSWPLRNQACLGHTCFTLCPPAPSQRLYRPTRCKEAGAASTGWADACTGWSCLLVDRAWP